MKHSTLNIMFTCIFFILAIGCDKYSKHEILTFFFTGVPPIDGEEDRVVSIIGEKTEEKESLPLKNWPSVHGPYDAKECDQCHVIKKQTIGKTLGPVPSLENLPTELLLPENKICIECHTTKDFVSAFKRDLWIHGPVSSGMCTICHHHHQSGFPYLLLQGNDIELCTRCHLEGLISDIDEHLRDEECTVCHNPHVGKNRFMLKKESFKLL